MIWGYVKISVLLHIGYIEQYFTLLIHDQKQYPSILVIQECLTILMVILMQESVLVL